MESGGGIMTDEELVIDFALARLDNPDLDIEEIAALLVRRMDPDRVLELASRNLATRRELRGAMFASAVEHVLRVVLLTMRGPVD
jgi:chromatin segregation and condensation protein Rec8/ScpA/Scc1 (kleisin family)